MNRFVYTAFLLVAFTGSWPAHLLESRERAVVWETRESTAIIGHEVNTSVVRSMVDRLVTHVTGEPGIQQAWQSLVQPGQTVGINVSARAAELISTRPELVRAVVESLSDAGVPKSRLVVWGRDPRFMARYREALPGVRVVSTLNGVGYDPETLVSAPKLGRLIWGDLEFEPIPLAMDEEAERRNLSNRSHFSRVLTSEVDLVINLPVLMEHVSTGMAGALFEAAIPNVDNWRRFVDGRDGGDPFIPQVYSELPRPVVLHLMDALFVQYAGGPEPHPNYSHRYRTLLASLDPVALDRVAFEKLEGFRREAELPALEGMATYINTAGRMRLGVSDADRIDLRRLEP